MYTIVRFYGIDPRVFFYHERELDDPARSEFHALVDTCTEEEALTLTPIVRAILEALRRKGSITLEDNTFFERSKPHYPAVWKMVSLYSVFSSLRKH